MSGADSSAGGDALTARQRDFLRRKQRFAGVLALIVFLFFVPLPILGGFTPLLDAPVFGGVTVAWLYAFAQFLLAIAAAALYMRRAEGFDAEATELMVADGLPGTLTDARQEER